MNTRRQTAIGLSLALVMIGAWVAAHIYGVFVFRLTWMSAPFAVVLIAVQTWLGAGMFITAHDAMHGSLAPGRPRVNTAVGQVSIGLYAAFPYATLSRAHHAHHRAPGTAQDPDFHADGPRRFWPWYAKFFTTYFGGRQVAVILTVFTFYALVLHASVVNAALFWGLPAIASSMQLFTFGTWLPHRHEDAAFADKHRARTLEYGWLVSLLTCYHFGYHLEHHHTPATPWWGLPGVRRLRLAAEAAGR